MRHCLPLSVLLRSRLKYALSGHECLKICKDKDANIKIDNRIRRDHRFPLGLMDVVTIEKTGESFRILYDVKGRFQAVRISGTEASMKLCKIKRKSIGKNNIPYVVTHDGRTIRYPHPEISINDSIKYNLESGEIDGVIKLENGSLCFINGGNNIGRVGVLQHIEVHQGSYNIAHIKDSRGHAFATRLDNVFVIGNDHKSSAITLPKKLGVRQTLIEERDERFGRIREESAEEDDDGEASEGEAE